MFFYIYTAKTVLRISVCWSMHFFSYNIAIETTKRVYRLVTNSGRSTMKTCEIIYKCWIYSNYYGAKKMLNILYLLVRPSKSATNNNKKRTV